MARYLSSQGLTNLRTRITELESRMSDLHNQAAKDYANSGDAWHDNPQWELSNQQRKAIQRQIRDLRDLEVHYTLLDDLPYTGLVGPGTIVTIQWIGEEDHEEYTVLGEGESNPDNMIISYETDLAKALLDHKKDEVVNFHGQQISIINVQKWTSPK